ncbi:hypothetical protein CBER1_08602 [Cercospora berteroae]|uniref:C2H2-type domain-containing protein n=1 Tax=Cercospora berteroae TaxID=357750 RepID=A0A2S6CMG4_9PEZI|nr:hypothetical protein CBER1_08602 [Cercospora berteroae]
MINMPIHATNFNSSQDDTWDINDEIIAFGGDGAERVYQIHEVGSTSYKKDMDHMSKCWIAYRAYIQRPVSKEDLFPQHPTQGNIHSFFLYLLHTKKGRIDAKLAVTTLKRHLTMFTVLYTATTGRRIDEKVCKQIKKAIRWLLVEKGASLKSKPRSLANRPVVLDLLHFLWARDEYHFRHPRQRLQLSLQVMLMFYLGGRPGEFVESSAYSGSNEGLLYKDLQFIIVKRGNKKRILLLVKIRLQKGRRHVEKTFIDLPLIQDSTNPELCPVVLLLALAIADGALEGITTTDDLDSVDPDDGGHAILRIKDLAEETPVLRAMEGTIKRGDRNLLSSTRISTAGWLSNQVGMLSERAGYKVKLVSYDFRRGHANAINEQVRPEVRRQRMGHKSDDTFLHYISSVSAVDTQAMLHERDPETELLEFIKSAALHRTTKQHEQLPQDDVFPLRSTYLEASVGHRGIADYYSSTKDRAAVSRLLRATLHHDSARSEVIKLFYHREDDDVVPTKTVLQPLIEMAAPVAKDWHYPGVEPVGNACPHCMYEPSSRSCACQERCKHHLRTCHMASRTNKHREDLHALILRRNPQCRWMKCRKDFKGLSLARIAKHIAGHLPDDTTNPAVCSYDKCIQQPCDDQDALKYHLLMEHLAPHPELLPSWYYCFECAEYMQCEQDWRVHCQLHLQKLDMSCGVTSENDVLILPGLCPFCLADHDLPAAKKYNQYIRKFLLHSHITKEHLSRAKWPLPCPHPKCEAQLESVPEFWDHVEEIHHIQPPQEYVTLQNKRKGKVLSKHSLAEVPQAQTCDSGTQDPSSVNSSPSLPEHEHAQRQKAVTDETGSRKTQRSGSCPKSPRTTGPVRESEEDVLSSRRTPSPRRSSSPLFVPQHDDAVEKGTGDRDGVLAGQDNLRGDAYAMSGSLATSPTLSSDEALVASDPVLGSTPANHLVHATCLDVGGKAVGPGYSMKRCAPDALTSPSKRTCSAAGEGDYTCWPAIPRVLDAEDTSDLPSVHAQVALRLSHLKLQALNNLADSPTLKDCAWSVVLAGEDLLYHFYAGEDIGTDDTEQLEKDMGQILGSLLGRRFSEEDVGSLAAERMLPIDSRYLTHPGEAQRKSEREKTELAEEKSRKKAARIKALAHRTQKASRPSGQQD